MNPFLKSLAEKYGTPFYSYDLEEARKRSEELRELFPADANPRLLFSFKANPLSSLAEELRRAGCEADLTSEGELASAKISGFDLGRALYGGPGKGEAEWGAALDAGIRHFSIESWTDLGTLAAAVRKRKVEVTGLLRVNPLNPPRARVAMAGVASQFGFEETALGADARDRLQRFADAVTVRGFHIYWGTQIGDAEALTAAFESAIEIAERLAAGLRLELRILNLGGGFPWPYAHRGPAPDLSALRGSLRRLRDRDGPAGRAEWWFESGRYLTASSGVLVARVMDVKESKDRKFVILDAGIHHLGGMAGLGRIPRFSVDLETCGGGDALETVDLVGPLCTPLDCVGRNIEAPPLKPGDLVSIPNVGAYGLTGSLVAFLSRPAPLEIAFRGEEVRSVIRLAVRQETLA